MDNRASIETLRHALMDIVTLTTKVSDNPDIEKVQDIARKALLEYTSLTLSTTGSYKHIKRGSHYNVESIIQIQASTGPIIEGDLVVSYRSIEDRIGYGRKLSEFNDGRFIRI